MKLFGGDEGLTRLTELLDLDLHVRSRERLHDDERRGRLDAAERTIARFSVDREVVTTRHVDIDLDQVFTLINLDEDSSKKHPFPCPTTYRTALSYYVEITALPR